MTLPYLFESELGLPRVREARGRPGAQAVTAEPSRRLARERPLGLARRAGARSGASRWSSAWSVAAGSSTARSPLLVRLVPLAGLVVVHRLVPSLRWRRWRWDVRPEAIDIRHGTFTIRRTLVPMLRVQHVDTTQRPRSSSRSTSPPSWSTPPPAATRSRCSVPTRRARERAARTGSPEPRAGPPMTPERAPPAPRGDRRLRAQRAARGARSRCVIVVVLAGFGGGLDERRAAPRRVLRRVGIVAATVLGCWRWWTTTLVGDARGDPPQERADRPQGDRRAAHAGSSRSTSSRGRCSACSASTPCTSRRAAAAPRARSCSRRSATTDLDELRALVADRRPAPVGGAPGRSGGSSGAMLLVAALTAGQLGVILPALAGVAQLAQNVARHEPRRRRAADPAHASARGLLAAARCCSSPRGCCRCSARSSRSPASRSRATATGCGSAAACWRAARRRCRSTRVRAVEVVEGVLRLPVRGSPRCAWR